MSKSSHPNRKRRPRALPLFGLAAILVVWPVAGSAQETGGGFEGPQVVDAALDLPASLLAGDRHRVENEVLADGYSNNYTIRSDFGDFKVVGAELLRARIQEVAALATLAEIKKTDAFAKGAINAAKSPLKATRKLLLEPVETISNIPRGIYRYASRLGEMATSEPSRQEQGRIKELMGFAALKRKIAHALKVDVYSSNAVLQDELDEVTWTGFAGATSFSLLFAMVPVPAVLSLQMQSVKYTQRANSFLRDNAPADLRILNREALINAGLDKGVVEAFLDNRWLSPTHQTRIAMAVAALDGAAGRDILLRGAMGARSENHSLRFQQLAEMAMVYHQRVVPVSALDVIIDTPALVTARRALVVMLPADRLLWTRWLAERADAAALYQNGPATLDSREFWVAGTVSPRALRELAARNITVVDKARDRLAARTREEDERASP